MSRRIMSKLEPYYTKNILEAGIDEAGRGPLFGRVYVGVAILPQDTNDFNHSLLKDSKKFTSKERIQEAYDYIKDYAIDYQVAWCDEDTIDRINIRNAVHKAMHDAVSNLRVKPQHLLVDGRDFTHYAVTNDKDEFVTIPHTCIEGGDNKFTPIAAGSILAKVERDAYIEEMCETYPNLVDFYDLKNNKGYGTKNHLAGIKMYGISEWHRKTFGICKSFSKKPEEVCLL